MIRSLKVSNFAVVDEAAVDFGPGLTVLTGETGAGKSILVDALGLLVGGRAAPDVIREGATEAVVEVTLERTSTLAARLEELGLPDLGDEVVVRRVVGAGSKSRVHVNGSLATVGVLGRLMRGVIDVAGQSEHVGLFDPATHLALIDAAGGHQEQVARCEEAWGKIKAVDAKLAALGGDASQVAARLEFLDFQLDEISRLAPKPGEDAALEAELKRLQSIDRLQRACAAAEEAVDGEGGAVAIAGRALASVQEAEKLDPGVSAARQSLTAALAELDAASRALSRYASGLEADPGRLQEVDERLDALRRLCRKHQTHLEGLFEKRQKLQAERDDLSSRGERRTALELELGTLREQAYQRAMALRTARLRASRTLSRAVKEGLLALAMPFASFEVQVDVGPLGPSGVDQVTFLFSANAGEPPRPLHKVASGGEASRLLLAVKAALLDADDDGVSVFDEADSGVGGAVADAVGLLLKKLSGRRQVLCVTHLPQVAAWADQHLLVKKAVARGRSRSRVEPLEEAAERERELARMLSGAQVSKEALGAARSLLKGARSARRVRRAEAAAAAG